MKGTKAIMAIANPTMETNISFLRVLIYVSRPLLILFGLPA